MSFGGNLSGITFAGLSSGIDTDSIISRLLQIEAIPIRRLERRQAELQARMDLYGQLRSRLSGLSSAASALNSPTSYMAVQGTSSDSSVANVSVSTGAPAGVFTLAVKKLAQAHKIASDAQASAGQPLDLSGTFVVNGRAIEVAATDSLSAIATKINGAGAGVVASVIDGGTNNAYLTITSAKTGADRKVQLGDLGSDSVLATLGLVSGAATVRKPIPNGAAGFDFSSAAASLASLLGTSGLAPGTVGIGDGSIDIDESDTLISIAEKINDPGNGTGVMATVVSSTIDGEVRYRLEIVGPSGTPAFTDDGGWLQALGILQRGYKNQTISAQDAEFSIDGVNLTSTSNTITSVVSGATITLLKADADNPPTTTITISRDTDAVKRTVSDLMGAYNAMIDFIRRNSQFDSETFRSGFLFGDPVALQAESMISALIFDRVEGLEGPYTSLADIGFGFDENGLLTLDEATLATAIATNLDAVQKLLATSGSTTSEALSYIGASSKTVPSPVNGYEVVISQIATKASFVGAAPGDTVTFSGSLFGSTPYTILLSADVDEAVEQINSDARLRELLVASNDGGELKLVSKRWGSPGNFEIEGMTGTSEEGLNVEGTINGEATKGIGQFLTGESGNATTDGLQIQYTGSELGSVGYVKVLKGTASQVFDLMGSFLDSVNGMVTASDESLKAQYDDISASIKAIEERLISKEQLLRRQFTAMETAIAQMQAQQARLAAIFNGMQNQR